MRFVRYNLMFAVLVTITLGATAQPSFKGGEAALSKFLKEHIIYPEFSGRNCITATIRVKFRVIENGKVEQVSAVNGLGIDLDDEAVRVIKMTTGKWQLPAGMEMATMIVPIRFAPEASHCASATKLSRQQAIQTYQARQAQEDVITNYYKAKYAGGADTTRQKFIEGLKQQLGFDDSFIDDLLQQAEEKRKQGDNEGACTDWIFIRNIGSRRADLLLSQYCK